MKCDVFMQNLFDITLGICILRLEFTNLMVNYIGFVFLVDFYLLTKISAPHPLMF